MNGQNGRVSNGFTKIYIKPKIPTIKLKAHRLKAGGFF